MAAEAREPCGEAVLNQKFVKKIDNENEPSAARKGSVSALFEESGEIAPVDVGGGSECVPGRSLRAVRAAANRQRCEKLQVASVPIPKFARARGSLDANFGIKGTLATL